MKISLGNFDGWQKAVLDGITGFDQQIVDARKRVASELTDAFLENIPVWSGRTARSVHISNTGPLPIEPHPDRGDTSSDGFFKHHQEFGTTSQMALGSEPMRASAEAIARTSVEATDYGLDKPVYLTVGSTAWGLVEVAGAPTEAGARNTAVVSEIALAKIRAMFGYVK